MGGWLFTPEEVAFLRDNRLGRTCSELALMFNVHFERDLSVRQIETACDNRGFRSGQDGRFRKGLVPFNKGMKGIQQGGKDTQFKKGHVPVNHRPIGSERINVDGYVEIKVSEPKTWRAKHVVLWEAAHGPVPSGHAVVFGDGDRQNITLENLLLISRKELAVLNKRHLIGGSRELTEAGRLIANISMKITARRKHERSKSQCSTTDN
jgi:hypothetical protein